MPSKEREAAEVSADQVARRIAPSRDKVMSTRNERKTKRDRRDQMYGKPTTFRFDESTRKALDKACEQLGVKKSNLVEFLIRAGLVMIVKGHIKPPFVEGDVPTELRLPDLPERFL